MQSARDHDVSQQLVHQLLTRVYVGIVRQLVLWDIHIAIQRKMEFSDLGIIVLYLIRTILVPAKLNLLSILF